MSSILEALKKLEAEKAAKKARQRSAAPFSGHTEAEILVPPADASSGPPRFSQGAKMVIAASLLAVVVVGTSAITASLIMSGGEKEDGMAPVQVAMRTPPVQAAQLAATPAAASAGPAEEDFATGNTEGTSGNENTKRPATTPENRESPPAPVLAPPAPIAPAVSKVPGEAEDREAVKLPEKASPPKAPEVEPEASKPMHLAAVAQKQGTLRPDVPKTDAVPPMAKPEPAAAREPFKPEIIVVGKLPPMRMVDRGKYGLEHIKVNMLRGISEARPYGQAIINLDKVMVGEVIPDTKVMLIAIDEHLGKIGVEVLETGERFKFPDP